jgi:hypothetical protein
MKLWYEYRTQCNVAKCLEIETLYEASNQGVEHDTMKALQKSLNNLQA